MRDKLSVLWLRNGGLACAAISAVFLAFLLLIGNFTLPALYAALLFTATGASVSYLAFWLLE